MSVAFLERREFVLCVLGMKSVAMPAAATVNEKLRNYVCSLQSLKASSSELRTLKRELDGGSRVCQILKDYYHRFSFVRQFCEEIVAVEDTGAHVWESLAQALLRITLVWLSEKHGNEFIPLGNAYCVCVSRCSGFYEVLGGSLARLLYSGFYYSFRSYIRKSDLQELLRSKQIFMNMLVESPNLDARYYEIFARILHKMPVAGDVLSEEATEVLSLVSIMQNAHSVQYRKEFLADIVGYIFNTIVKLDPYALTCFGYFSWAFDQETLSNYMGQIADCVAERILAEKESTVKISVGDWEESREEEPISLNDECCHFTDSRMLLHAVDFDKGMVFPDRVSMESLIPRGISKAAIGLCTMFNSAPFNAISFTKRLSIRFRKCFDGIALLLYVLRDVKTSDKCVEFLFDSVLYDERLTLFSEGPSMSALSTLRAIALDLMKPTTSDVLPRFVEHIRRKPLIMAEHCYRIVQSQIYYHMSADVRHQFTYQILKTANYYKVTKDDLVGIENALTSIFVLLSHMFSVDGFTSEFFSEVFFASSFVSFVFEDALKGFVIRVVQDHLRTDAPPDDEVPPLLANVLVVAMDSFGNDRAFQLVIDVLKALNDLLSVKTKLPLSIVVIRAALPDVLIGMSEFPENPLSHQIFLEALQFFTLTSGTERSKTLAVSSFTKSMSKLFGDHIPEDFYLKIIQLLAGTSLSSVKPNFTIREPRFVMFLLDTYSRSPKFSEVLSFMSELCEYSQKNCIACHVGKVDLYLLGLMKKGNQPTEIVDKCMKILVLIASLGSSPEVVQNFLSLLSSKNGIISPLEPVYMKTMTAIVSKSALRPYAYFPLVSNGIKVSLPNIQSKALTNGFTFGCWLFADQFASNYVPHLFTLKDDGGQYFKFTMKYGAFIAEMKAKKTRSESIIEMKSSINVWSLVTLTFHFEETVTKAYFQLNGKTLQEMTFPKFGFMHPASLSIGRTDVNSSDSDDSVKMASFGLFPALQIGDVMFLQQSGPRMLYRPAFDAFIAARTGKKRNHVVISKIKGSSDMIVEGDCRVLGTNFADILVETCSVELLLPLFSQMDCHDPDGNCFSNCIELSLELFGITVTSNIEAQKSLVESDACSVIADILKNVKKMHLGYSLYVRFFGFFQSIQYQPLQKELMRCVLFNGELLKRCDEDNQMLIVKHWTRTLFPVSISLGLELPSVSDILAMLDIYFWYDKVSDDQYGEAPAKDVVSIRKLMFELVCLLPITRDDIANIISFCVNSADSQQVHDVMEFLQSLVEQNSLTEVGSALSKFQVQKILVRCMSEDHQLFVDSIKTMFLLIDKGLVPNLTKVEVVDIIMNLSGYIQCTEDTFKSLRQLFDENPELLPLVLWMGYILHLESAFVALAPSPKYCTHFTWPLWPIAIALKSSDVIREILVQFLVKCDSNQWENVFCTAGVVASALHEDPGDIQKLLLCKICQLCLSGSYQGPPNVIYDLVYRLMFFRQGGTMNEALANEFRSASYPIEAKLRHGRSTARFSPKAIRKRFGRALRSNTTVSENDYSCPSAPHPPMKRTDLLPVQFYDAIMRIEDARPTLSFGLSMSSTGGWKDIDLAVFFLRIFCDRPVASYQWMAFVMLGFLNRVGNTMSIDVYISPSKDVVGSDIFLAYEIMRYQRKQPSEYGSIAKAPLLIGEVMPPVFSQKLARTEMSVVAKLKLYLSSLWQKTSVVNNAAKMECSFCHEFSENVKKRNYIDHVMWKKLWQKLTSVKAPWNESEENSARIQRTSLVCSDFCPMKFKSELKGNKESYDFQFKSPKQRLKKKRRSLTGVKSLEFNATVISLKKRTDALLTVEPDGYKLEYARDQRKVRYDTILHSSILRKNADRSSRIYLVLKDRSPMLIDCADEIIKQIPASQQLQWNETWTEKWVNRRMSTFSYLMKLNVFYGRTFSDLDNYPVMPSLVRDLMEPNLPTKLVALNYLKSIEPFSNLTLQRVMTEGELEEYDWIPEMFFDSKILPFSQVYKNRKVLESDAFSCRLNEWIEAVWPVSMPHPMRREHTNIPVKITKFEIPVHSIAACTISSSKTGSSIVVFGDDKMLDITTDGRVTTHPFKLPGDRLLVTSFRNAIVLSQYKSLDITLINKKTSAFNDLMMKNGSIIAMCSDSDKIILAMRDTIIKIIDSTLTTTVLRTYFCAVTCVDYRQKFDLIALGNKEGSILLCSPTKQKVTSTFKLKNKRAISITITPKWGLIVVLAADKYRSTNWLCTYTMNGDFIAEAKDTREITSLCSFSSGTGTDYIVTGDVNGVITICEAATLSSPETVARAPPRILSLGYDASTAHILAVSASGHALRITQRLP